jgi:hypothetical protein
MATKQTTDQIAQGLIQEVKKQKQEIAKIKRPEWKTNRVFSYIDNDTSKAINLATVSDTFTLIKIASFIETSNLNFINAAGCLGLDSNNYTFTWMGFTPDDWIKDLRARVQQIQVKTKEDKLKSLEQRLDSIISPELKRELELQAIIEELK